MLKEFTCIMCPRGCEVTAEVEGKEVLSVEGNFCPKGREYVLQELTNPMRNIASSVLVRAGELPLASVRLNGLIPKDRIFDVMAEIRKTTVDAPTAIGQVVIENVLGLGCDVVVTKMVGRREE